MAKSLKLESLTSHILFHNIIFVFCIIIFCIQCKTNEQIDTKPDLELLDTKVYKNKAAKDSIILFNLKFEDLNGNIGLSDHDTFPPFDLGSPFNSNLIIDYYSFDGNQFKKILIPLTSDTLNFNQRIKPLLAQNVQKRIVGTFKIPIPASPYPGIFPSQIKLNFTLIDKTLLKSNMVTSQIIQLNH